MKISILCVIAATIFLLLGVVGMAQANSIELSIDKTLSINAGYVGDIITVTLDIEVPINHTVTVVDTLPLEWNYVSGTFTVDGTPAIPTITSSPPTTEIYYTIIMPGTYAIEFDCIVNASYGADHTVYNVATATWYKVWDVDNDFDCDIADLVQIAADVSLTGDPGWIPEDVDRDGDVDVMDLMIASNHVPEYYDMEDYQKEDTESFVIHPTGVPVPEFSLPIVAVTSFLTSLYLGFKKRYEKIGYRNHSSLFPISSDKRTQEHIIRQLKE